MGKFDPKKMMDYINKGNSDIHKKVTLDVLTYVIAKSPVSPVNGGTYRANHFVSQDKPTSETTNSTANNAQSRGQQVMADFTAFGVKTYVQNNLPYALPLEFGHSQQAPNGVYRLARQAVTK